jgi:hypothetical protein
MENANNQFLLEFLFIQSSERMKKAVSQKNLVEVEIRETMFL